MFTLKRNPHSDSTCTTALAGSPSVTFKTLDTVAPRVVSIGRLLPSPTNAGVILWQVIFSEPVVNVSADGTDFALAGVNATLTATPISATTYSVAADSEALAAFNGTVTLSFANNQDIEDANGNALANTTPTSTHHNTYLVDNTRSTVTIGGVPGASMAPFTATFTFSEAVTDFDAADIGLVNAGASGFTEDTAGTTWSATIAPTADGAVHVDVAANAAEDAAGNGNTAATRASSTYTAPTADGVTLAPATLALTELDATNATKTYSAVLNTDPGTTVTVTVASGDTIAVVDADAGTTGNQSTLTFTGGGSGTWDDPQTATVSAVNDADTTSESGIEISHTATATDVGSPYHQLDIDDVTVNVTDAGHGLVISTTTLDVRENTGTATYAVRLKSQPSAAVTVGSTSDDFLKVVVASVPLSFATGAWDTAQTVTVAGNGAASDTATISHVISGSATEYTTLTGLPTVAVTVTADTRPSLTVVGGSAVTEGGNPAFTFTLSATPSSQVPFAFVSRDAPADFLAAAFKGRISESNIPANGTTRIFNLATVDDNNDEPNARCGSSSTTTARSTRWAPRTGRR